MTYVPFKNLLGKPLQLKTGNVYYEKELDEAILKYENQFKWQKIELLEKYSKFLEESGYMDSDWWSEEPGAINEFLKTNPK